MVYSSAKCVFFEDPVIGADEQSDSDGAAQNKEDQGGDCIPEFCQACPKVPQGIQLPHKAVFLVVPLYVCDLRGVYIGAGPKPHGLFQLPGI